MIDIQFIREHSDRMKDVVRQKNAHADIDAILRLDTKRRELAGRLNDVNQARNAAAKEKNIEEGKRLKGEAAEVEAELKTVEAELNQLLLAVPNIPSDDTPVGAGEEGNVVLRTVGEPTTFNFTPKDHVDLGLSLGLLEFEKAVSVSGARFVYLKGDLVLLQNALHQFALSILLDAKRLKRIASDADLDVPNKPFTLVQPPLMMKTEVMQRMARLEPRDERYHIPSDDTYLIGSAEHTLGPLHMDEMLDEATLPIRYVAFTPAFRREAGSYGKDTKGIIRLHQFDKIEMESFSTPEMSMQEHLFFVAIQEYIVSELGLPYRVVLKCTGDQGDPDARASDIETWMPGQGTYRETHTADLMTDYQARRLATKVKRTDGTKTFAHMNDATAIAMGRLLVAILENDQTEEGSVRVPKVLQTWMGKKEIRKESV